MADALAVPRHCVLEHLGDVAALQLEGGLGEGRWPAEPSPAAAVLQRIEEAITPGVDEPEPEPEAPRPETPEPTLPADPNLFSPEHARPATPPATIPADPSLFTPVAGEGDEAQGDAS